MARQLEARVRLQADVRDAIRNLRDVDRALDDLEDGLRDAGSATESSSSALSRFADFLKRRLVITLQDVAGTVRAVWATIQDTITLEGQEQALRAQLGGMGRDFDEFIETLDRAAAGTLSTANAISASSRALLLGIPADEIANLLEIAGSRARATGQSVEQAFNDITTGIGRASPLILDNLGFVIRLEEAYAGYADTVGKSSAELSKAEQSQALLNEVLRQGREDMEALGTAADGTFKTLQQGEAQFENFQAVVGRLFTALASLAGAGLTAVIEALTLIAQILPRLVQRFAEMASVLPGVGDEFARLAQISEQADATLEGYVERLRETRRGLAGLSVDLVKSVLGFEEQERAITRSAAASQAYIDQMRGVTEETGSATETTRELVETLDEEIDAAARAVPEIRQLAQTYRELGAATASSGLAGSGRIRARSASSQALVDEALAAGRRPGKTRIRIRGGSRLIDWTS